MRFSAHGPDNLNSKTVQWQVVWLVFAPPPKTFHIADSWRWRESKRIQSDQPEFILAMAAKWKSCFLTLFSFLFSFVDQFNYVKEGGYVFRRLLRRCARWGHGHTQKATGSSSSSSFLSKRSTLTRSLLALQYSARLDLVWKQVNFHRQPTNKLLRNSFVFWKKTVPVRVT